MTATFSTIPAFSVGKTTLSCRLSLSSGEKTKQTNKQQQKDNHKTMLKSDISKIKGTSRCIFRKKVYT